MNRRSVKEEIKKELNCSDEEAERIIVIGLKNGHIKRQLNWNILISIIISWAVVITGVWALWRVIIK
tara:strand:+ start:304 stop:504 length:201 start_codon:yes stop_codon:yes gene_type:complete